MKWIFNICGGIFVGLAFAGAFLPLLPTTPFLLLAAFCFSRGSPRMHRWLMEHPRMGPIIHDWQHNRVIRPRVKRMASFMMILIMVPGLVFSSFPIAVKAISAVVGLGVIVMIWSYPSNPRTAGAAERQRP